VPTLLTFVYEVLVNRVGTNALVLVICDPYTVPFSTWYWSRAASISGFAVRVLNVALSTFANAAFDGARMVIFWAPPRI
jgi:hypothetical protein